MFTKRTIYKSIKRAFRESKRISCMTITSHADKRALTFLTDRGTFRLRLMNMSKETKNRYASLSYVVSYTPPLGNNLSVQEDNVIIVKDYYDKDEMEFAYTPRDFVSGMIDYFEEVIEGSQVENL